MLDGSAAQQIIVWGQGNSLVAPTDWKSTRAHELARKWAELQDRPDPNTLVEQMLAKVIQAKRSDPDGIRFVRAKKLLEQTLSREQELLTQAVPHIQNYLPSKTPLRASVFFAVFLPVNAFTLGNDIVVTLTSDWKDDPNQLLNLLVHELYHVGFSIHSPGTGAEQEPSESSLGEQILWEIQNEGLATYVAYLVRSPGLQLDDYTLSDDPAEVQARFANVRALLENARLGTEPPSTIREQMWRTGVEQRGFYIVGAHMARQIEQALGRSALVDTVSGGPQLFIEAYARTAPAPELVLQ